MVKISIKDLSETYYKKDKKGKINKKIKKEFNQLIFAILIIPCINMIAKVIVYFGELTLKDSFAFMLEIMLLVSISLYLRTIGKI